MTETCTLHDPEWNQCCCNCVHHHAVHYNCCTRPKPSQKKREAAGVAAEGRCVCRVRKGWACMPPWGPEARIYDRWPEHSVGCEEYKAKDAQPREPSSGTENK